MPLKCICKVFQLFHEMSNEPKQVKRKRLAHVRKKKAKGTANLIKVNLFPVSTHHHKSILPNSSVTWCRHC